MSHSWACLLGQPVAHSLSPALHNAAFSRTGIDAHYEAWDISPDGLALALERLRSPDCLGANVTAPHKQTVIAFLDGVSEAAQALGAVNTIVNEGGRLSGSNTDAAGLARWMRAAAIEPAGQACLVLGAGGAARASVWALAELGASSILVLNRTPARADELILSLRPRLGSYSGMQLSSGALSRAAEPAAVSWRVIVNATSLGHHAGAPNVHPSCYSPQTVAVELVYNPPVTGFMVAAREAGSRAENGLGMLVNQAALAFECWTGLPAPMDAYEAAARHPEGDRRPTLAP